MWWNQRHQADWIDKTENHGVKNIWSDIKDEKHMNCLASEQDSSSWAMISTTIINGMLDHACLLVCGYDDYNHWEQWLAKSNGLQPGLRPKAGFWQILQPSPSPAEPFAQVGLGQAFEGWVPWAQGLEAWPYPTLSTSPVMCAISLIHAPFPYLPIWYRVVASCKSTGFWGTLEILGGFQWDEQVSGRLLERP